MTPDTQAAHEAAVRNVRDSAEFCTSIGEHGTAMDLHYVANMADAALMLERLVREVIYAHCDGASPWYNECHEGAECMWCENAKIALAAIEQARKGG